MLHYTRCYDYRQCRNADSIDLESKLQDVVQQHESELADVHEMYNERLCDLDKQLSVVNEQVAADIVENASLLAVIEQQTAELGLLRSKLVAADNEIALSHASVSELYVVL